jgi:hypothetical protein
MKAGVTSLNIATIPSFAWNDLGKSRKTAARTRGRWRENQTWIHWTRRNRCKDWTRPKRPDPKTNYSSPSRADEIIHLIYFQSYSMPWRVVTGTCHFHVDMTFSRKWLQTLFSPGSSSTRQRFPLHHDQCQAQIDTVFYSVLCWLCLSFCLLMDSSKVWRLTEIFWKFHLEQTGLNWINIPPITIDNNFTWVISKVLHTVRFLFKNECIL